MARRDEPGAAGREAHRIREALDGVVVHSFRCSPANTLSYEPTTVSWSTTLPAGLHLSINGTRVGGPSGTLVRHPSASESYRLVAHGDAGDVDVHLQRSVGTCSVEVTRRRTYERTVRLDDANTTLAALGGRFGARIDEGNSWIRVPDRSGGSSEDALDVRPVTSSLGPFSIRVHVRSIESRSVEVRLVGDAAASYLEAAVRFEDRGTEIEVSGGPDVNLSNIKITLRWKLSTSGWRLFEPPVQVSVRLDQDIWGIPDAIVSAITGLSSRIDALVTSAVNEASRFDAVSEAFAAGIRTLARLEPDQPLHSVRLSGTDVIVTYFDVTSRVVA